MASTETANIICFLEGVWAREGYPESLVSDNGAQFTSGEFETYLIRRDITHHRASAYWPQGNGAVERFNRTFKTWLQEHHDGGIVERIRRLLANYRATPHCSTGYSPSVMLHGRNMRLKFPVFQQQVTPNVDSVRRRVNSQQLRNKRHYDRRHAVRPSELRPGDQVFVRKPGHLPKTARRFCGPLQIVSRRGASFQLSDGSTRNPQHLVCARGASDGLTSDEPECLVELPPVDTEKPGNLDAESTVADSLRTVPQMGTSIPTDTNADELPPSSRGRLRRRPSRFRDYVT